ncbi:MAG: Fic family protein [Nitrosopumilales archaeon]|nr:Fic family protein [Nitrosopumilales archaeon]
MQSKEIYLGRKIPRNIEEIKGKLLKTIYEKEWYPLLDRIKEKYSKEIKLMPRSSREKQMAIFASRFTYNTQRIEGSKLTLKETANLLEKGITPKDKPLEDVKEAEAHKRLFYAEVLISKKKDLSLNLVVEWHRKLFQETKPDIAGKIRKHQTRISGSKFIPPLPVEVYPLLREFFKWYDRNKGKNELHHPVELAAFVHLKFVTIHPFGDGNGRISRLMMNFVLNKEGYPMLDIPYSGRNSYYTALERAQVKKVDSAFIQWFMRKYMKENDTYS